MSLAGGRERWKRGGSRDLRGRVTGWSVGPPGQWLGDGAWFSVETGDFGGFKQELRG